jgi:hypothetical protein
MNGFIGIGGRIGIAERWGRLETGRNGKRPPKTFNFSEKLNV